MNQDKDEENEAPNPEFEAFDALVRQVIATPNEVVQKALDAENAVPKKRGRPKKKRKNAKS